MTEMGIISIRRAHRRAPERSRSFSVEGTGESRSRERCGDRSDTKRIGHDESRSRGLLGGACRARRARGCLLGLEEHARIRSANGHGRGSDPALSGARLTEEPHRSSAAPAPGTLRVRVNGPMAAIVIGVVWAGVGSWLALVLSKTIPIETGWLILSHAAVWISANVIPSAIQWYREKRLVLDFGSDPPSKGEPNGSGS